MTGAFFVDTNVLVYYFDASEQGKQRQARTWLNALWQSGGGRLSFQVLSEFYATIVRRFQPEVAAGEARAYVRDLLTWQPMPIDGPTMEAAWTLRDQHGFSWWDSLIVASALRAGCNYLLTEDLQHGQKLNELTIISPFLMTPEEVSP